MISTNRLICSLRITMGVVCVLACGYAHAAVLYDENFTGSALDILHGTSPDVDNNGGFNNWAANSGYRADGTLGAGGRGAWLPFVPENGNVYTLDASFSGVGPDGASANWLAIGFSQDLPSDPENGTNRFLEGPTLGQAWMLFRANNPGANANQILLNGAGQVENWAAGSPVEGGDVDMRIVLDTTGGTGTYSATFFAKRPTDATYTQVSSGVLPLLSEDIGAVGFARNFGALDGMATNFTLETTGSVIVPGDVTGEGDVNVLDFNEIRDHLFQSGTRSDGDLTNDGFVDFLDFRAWKNAHESGAGGGSLANLTIPEPGSCALSCFAIGVLLLPRWRRDIRRSSNSNPLFAE